MGFSGSIDGVLRAVGAETFFAICAAAEFACFCVCFFLSVFKAGYSLKKRAWFAVAAAGVCVLLDFRAGLLGEACYSGLAAFFGTVLSLPLLFVPVKSSDGKKERELARFIDDKIKEADSRERADSRESGYVFPTEKARRDVCEIKAEPQQKDTRADGTEELDFSHVKNVLQRLELSSLTTSDRKQIRDLETALYVAEREPPSEEIREKINEGLGNLLKIMARHGV
ncbi:MAG: hypothetical protein IJU83_00515 [Clostridia bacterium]|nr:hypothetical protein [Clostridia bacterium]